VAEQSADNKKKRLVKNPETFRERAIKAAEGSDKPSNIARAKGASSKFVSPVTTPVGKASSKVFGLKPFRILGKILVPPYFRNSWKELRLVTWPSWKESRSLTYAVLVFAVVFGGVIALVDYGLDKLFKNILLK
jgi:preprotein translocase SecE subunit